MKKVNAWVLSLMLLGITPAFADPDIRQEPVEFRKGSTHATLKGKIKGYQGVDYLLRGKAGQKLTVDFKPENSSAYFNVLPPGSEEALFVGSTSGDRYEGELPADGTYTVRVYLMRNAARRNETAAYTLDVGIGGESRPRPDAKPAGTTGGFDRTLELQGIRFHVTSPNAGSANPLRIVPAGLEIDNSPIERTIEGTVTGAEVADLNADGSPEIYVYAISAGSGSYGTLAAYSANRKKSLSEIHLPPVAEDKKLSKGYMGHDEFAVVENRLAQRFPIYRDGDTNARPTGKTRQIQYKLVPGEATWALKVDRVVEF
jgi:hypothetical protein